jgi:hypothetical protein
VPIIEAIPDNEGKYRSASVSLNGAYFPCNLYLEKANIYWYYSCRIINNFAWYYNA